MKRLFDLSAVIIFLPVILSVMALLAFFVAVALGSPVFFCQTRPGLNGKPFKMVKFRTMTNKKDKDGNLLDDSERMTRFGRFLRSTSLDELPELYNVLKGEMSLVGPRPLLMEYLPLYSDFQARRHLVRPGITGWAQINGRNAITWDERFRLDVWYVDNSSFFLDLKILFLTFYKVVKRSDITQEGHVTIEKFGGEK